MRKRTQYKKPSAKSKVPTLIIMIITLFVILFFGKRISDGIADFFVPNVPVTDQPAAATPDDIQPTSPLPKGTPQNSGAVIKQANQNAAQNLLKVLSEPSK